MIEPVDEIETVQVFEGKIEPDDIKKVEPSKHSMVYYALTKDSRLERIFRSVLEGVSDVINNESLGDLKNVISYFVPYGRQIDAVTDAIGEVITNKKNNNIMAKKKTQSKTWWGIIATVIGTILGAFGIAADPSFLADGFQLGADFEMLAAFVLAIIGWAVKSWGQRKAKEPIK